MLNLTTEKKAVYTDLKEKQYYERIMNPYRLPKLSALEKEQKRIDLDRERDLEEAPILKNIGYKLIFPCLNDGPKMNKYNSYLKLAKDL